MTARGGVRRIGGLLRRRLNFVSSGSLANPLLFNAGFYGLLRQDLFPIGRTSCLLKMRRNRAFSTEKPNACRREQMLQEKTQNPAEGARD